MGLQVKWNQFSSNNSHHISCTHKGLHARKWPDLMTYKPDFVSTLGYHWTGHTGTPLEPQVHWDATGTTLADASTQWCPSGDPVVIYIIGTHWNTTGKPLEDHWTGRPPKTHWLPTIISPVAFQCTLGSKFQAHWIATGLPLARGKGIIKITAVRYIAYILIYKGSDLLPATPCGSCSIHLAQRDTELIKSN